MVAISSIFIAIAFGGWSPIIIPSKTPVFKNKPPPESPFLTGAITFIEDIPVLMGTGFSKRVFHCWPPP